METMKIILNIKKKKSEIGKLVSETKKLHSGSHIDKKKRVKQGKIKGNRRQLKNEFRRENENV
jgi:hypothetical protein